MFIECGEIVCKEKAVAQYWNPVIRNAALFFGLKGDLIM